MGVVHGTSPDAMTRGFKMCEGEGNAKFSLPRPYKGVCEAEEAQRYIRSLFFFCGSGARRGRWVNEEGGCDCEMLRTWRYHFSRGNSSRSESG